MGISVDAIVWFGLLIEETPWDEEDYGGMEESWWRDENGCKNPYEPDWSAPNSDPEIIKWRAWQREWDEEHPIPFETVWLGHEEDNVMGLAVRGMVQSVYFGDPAVLRRIAFDGDELLAYGRFKSFCEEYGLGDDLNWYLGAHYSY